MLLVPPIILQVKGFHQKILSPGVELGLLEWSDYMVKVFRAEYCKNVIWLYLSSAKMFWIVANAYSLEDVFG